MRTYRNNVIYNSKIHEATSGLKNFVHPALFYLAAHTRESFVIHTHTHTRYSIPGPGLSTATRLTIEATG
jgi:hypothetical protein